MAEAHGFCSDSISVRWTNPESAARQGRQCLSAGLSIGNSVPLEKQELLFRSSKCPGQKANFEKLIRTWSATVRWQEAEGEMPQQFCVAWHSKQSHGAPLGPSVAQIRWRNWSLFCWSHSAEPWSFLLLCSALVPIYLPEYSSWGFICTKEVAGCVGPHKHQIISCSIFPIFSEYYTPLRESS